MTDPLRPFADMIRALWLSRTQGTGSTQRANPGNKPTDTRASVPVRSLRSHLRTRMAATRTAGPARMREAFVETVLLWELGEHLAPDPAFGEMVAKVSEQLAADPAVGERLNRVLTRLASETRA